MKSPRHIAKQCSGCAHHGHEQTNLAKVSSPAQEVDTELRNHSKRLFGSVRIGGCCQIYTNNSSKGRPCYIAFRLPPCPGTLASSPSVEISITCFPRLGIGECHCSDYDAKRLNCDARSSFTAHGPGTTGPQVERDITQVASSRRVTRTYTKVIMNYGGYRDRAMDDGKEVVVTIWHSLRESQQKVSYELRLFVTIGSYNTVSFCQKVPSPLQKSNRVDLFTPVKTPAICHRSALGAQRSTFNVRLALALPAVSDPLTR